MNRRHFSSLFAGTMAAGLVTGSNAAMAQLVNKYAEQLKNGEFNWFPERSASGPVLIIVSIPDQKVHVYRNGIRIAASSCSTGKPGHSTPTGVFKILQKDKNHRSSTYNNAPMPNMNRLTWSGIALHAGNLPGYPASHGCIRLPIAFSERLFQVTKLGMTVVIADNNSHPESIVHPGLMLDEAAGRQFAAVSGPIKQRQYSEGHAKDLKNTSVVISSQDRTVSVWEDEGVVAQGSFELQNHKRPLSNRLYELTGVDDRNQRLQWSATALGKGNSASAKGDLQRIKLPRDIREEVRKRTHQGMSVVTASDNSAPGKRSAEGFVIIDSIY